MFGRPHRVKPDPEKEKQFREDLKKEGGVEKKDIGAMIISAYLVILPVVAALLLMVCLVAFLFVRKGL